MKKALFVGCAAVVSVFAASVLCVAPNGERPASAASQRGASSQQRSGPETRGHFTTALVGSAPASLPVSCVSLPARKVKWLLREIEMSPGRKTAREFLAEFSEVASISRWVDGPVVELKGEATWRYFKGPAIAILEEACRAYGIRVIDKPEQTGGFGVVIASTRPGE